MGLGQVPAKANRLERCRADQWLASAASPMVLQVTLAKKKPRRRTGDRSLLSSSVSGRKALRSHLLGVLAL